MAEAQDKKFQPYIPSATVMPEFTLKAILLGSVFGLIFGAATVYLALTAGLTVSASIPIAVLAIGVFKYIGKSTILENNMVQTIGSAGESIAAGVAFTIPALIFLSNGEAYFNYFNIFTLSLVGGILGVLVALGIGFLVTLVLPRYDARPPWDAALAGVMMSVAVGLIAGYLPAARAAAVDPIDALRRD